MKYLCVFCGSSSGNNEGYNHSATKLGALMAKQNIGLVYGGASIGVMGAVADSVLANGGEVIGVIPEILMIKEVAHQSLTRLEVVSSMHQRKERMYALSDAFLTLPGGFGTLDELCEILTWRQLGQHQKPIGIFNDAGFFDYLIAHIDKSVEHQFIREAHRDMLVIGEDYNQIIDQLLP